MDYLIAIHSSIFFTVRSHFIIFYSKLGNIRILALVVYIRDCYSSSVALFSGREPEPPVKEQPVGKGSHVARPPPPLGFGFLTAGVAALSGSYRTIIIYCHGETVTTPDGLFAAANYGKYRGKGKKRKSLVS
jgi:hypothetical protein